MIPSTLTAAGPNRIAPSPVPVIWEQLPVTDGIFKDEITKINAPDMAISVIVFRFSFTLFFREINPAARNGRQIMPHVTQNATGRYPYIMCIAFATGAVANRIVNATVALRNAFSFFVILSSLLL